MLKGVGTSRDIGAIHDDLFSRGIWTKSMVKTYVRCPVQFERRYVYGEKVPPGWALAVGVLFDVALQRWGEAKLERRDISVAEIRQVMHDEWRREYASYRLKPPERDPDRTIDAKIRSLMRCYHELQLRLPEFNFRALKAVQPAYGYAGDIVLGGERIAGHPDFLFGCGPVDLKTVGQSSGYLRDGLLGNLMDYAFQSRLTDKRRSTLLVCIHDYKTSKPQRVRCLPEQIRRRHLDATGEVVHRVAESVRRGDFPPTVQLGKYPCVPKWCGFFGKCPVTKGLKT